jgi:hypothetical protein
MDTLSHFYKAPLQKLWPAIAAMALAACGGGGGGGTADTATATGTLTDAQVQGVSYSAAPSGVSGVTNAQGEYSYRTGDTVTFRLGTLTLGSVVASFANRVVTPIDLAGADNDDRLSNLLVLLQSLDADGDPANGIVIPSAAAAAVTTDVNLNAEPADFADASTNPALQAAMSAGGITTPIRSVEAAQAHFKEQGLKLLSSQIWVAYDDETAALLRVAEDGSYLVGEATPDDFNGFECSDVEPFDCEPVTTTEPIGQAGVEYGGAGSVVISLVDSYGYKVVATPSIDTNLSFGLSDPLPCDRFQSLGDKLSANGNCPDADDGLIDKAPNSPSGLVGVWALDSASDLDTVQIAFLPNGRFLLVDPVGDDDCGGPGVEFGSYSWNSTTGVLSLSNLLYDTNGCGGLFEDGQPYGFTLTLTQGGQQLSGTSSDDPGEPFTLFRISR